MDRERLERLLREPDNLFGPPTGRGYDYLRAGLTVAALALGTLSGWCLFALDPAPPPAAVVVLLPLAAPFHLGARALWFLWPFQFGAAWLVAVGVWYTTLYTAACRAGLRRPSRATRVGAAMVATAGWGAGLGLVLWDWAGR